MDTTTQSKGLIRSIIFALLFVLTSSGTVYGAVTKYGLPGIYNVTPITLTSGSGSAVAVDSQGRPILSTTTAFSITTTGTSTLATALIKPGPLYVTNSGQTVTSTLATNSFIIAQQSGSNLGKFYVDSSGNVSTSGTLQTTGLATLSAGGRTGTDQHFLLQGDGQLQLRSGSTFIREASGLQLSAGTSGMIFSSASAVVTLTGASASLFAFKPQSDTVGIDLRSTITSGNNVPGIRFLADPSSINSSYNASSGAQVFVLASSTINQSGTAYFEGAKFVVNASGTGAFGDSRLLRLFVSSTPLFDVDFRGNVMASGTGRFGTGGSAGKATCWKADAKTIGYCSSAVGAGGDCTCN